jgi:probable phosphoglycerate mutase
VKTFYLTRHGQTDSNLSGILQGQSLDAPLNDMGIKQAKRIGEYLKTKDHLIDRIISSDLIRAYQTAEIIGEILGVGVETDVRLREMNYGSWEGNFLDELMKTPEGKIWQESPSKWQMKNSETVKAVQDRMVNAITDYLQKFDYPLIVSHGITISAFLLYVKHLSLDGIKEYVPQNTEIYDFSFENGEFEEINSIFNR